jgi:hypothetical protein
MKKINVSLMAILTVAFLSWPAFAANQFGYDAQTPMLTDTAGLAAYPVGNQGLVKADIQRDVWQNPMLTDTAGLAAYPRINRSSDEQYGIAPAWEGREGDSNGMTNKNHLAYALPGINDNTN